VRQAIQRTDGRPWQSTSALARNGATPFVLPEVTPVTACDPGHIWRRSGRSQAASFTRNLSLNHNGTDLRSQALWPQLPVERTEAGQARSRVPAYLPADAESWVPICRRATTQIAGLPSGPIVGPIVTCCTTPLFQRTRTS
jgi:hypothetical protein